MINNVGANASKIDHTPHNKAVKLSAISKHLKLRSNIKTMELFFQTHLHFWKDPAR